MVSKLVKGNAVGFVRLKKVSLYAMWVVLYCVKTRVWVALVSKRLVQAADK